MIHYSDLPAGFSVAPRHLPFNYKVKKITVETDPADNYQVKIATAEGAVFAVTAPREFTLHTTADKLVNHCKQRLEGGDYKWLS